MCIFLPQVTQKPCILCMGEPAVYKSYNVWICSLSIICAGRGELEGHLFLVTPSEGGCFWLFLKSTSTTNSSGKDYRFWCFWGKLDQLICDKRTPGKRRSYRLKLLFSYFLTLPHPLDVNHTTRSCTAMKSEEKCMEKWKLFIESNLLNLKVIYWK